MKTIYEKYMASPIDKELLCLARSQSHIFATLSMQSR